MSHADLKEWWRSVNEISSFKATEPDLD